ncbi:MAG: tetratricopeptide repeat protein [Pseudomonadota bacterium]|nr:tetratricopeptide repeat protein [Pseudomonadota bacterium]
MFAAWLLASVAWAAVPELVVVGVHVPGLTGNAADTAADRLAEALDATGKVDALAPSEVRVRLAGREALIVDAFALGPGRDALREGKILYDRAQPDQAIPVLEQATRQLVAGLASSTDVRDLHDALTLLGLANAGLGNEAAARQAFRRSVTLNPSRQLDAVNYPPQIVALYAEVRSQAVAEPPCLLTITAPANAQLWIDGRQTPPGEVSMVPGEHHLTLRGTDGSSAFQTLTLAPGERKSIAPDLSPRAVGRAATDAAGRTRQTRDLYKSIGQYTDRDPVMVVGVTTDGQVALQVYAPASGNFSRALTADGGNDPVSAILDLVPAAVGFLTESGDIKSDRVSPQVVPLDIGSNAVLASLLLDPAKAAPPTATAGTARKGAPWYLWAGLGALAVGGGTTAAVVLATAGDDEGGDNGTITFGPIP